LPKFVTSLLLVTLTHNYEEHAGKVVGLRVRFVGSGELNYVRMWDENGQIFFEDDFLAEL